MRINEVVESLKRAGPLNVMWDPACYTTEYIGEFPWALICLADLMRTGHVARVLTPKLDKRMIEALATEHQTPVTYRIPLPESSAGAVPAIYEVGEIEGAEAAEWMRRNVASGPWIVLGFEGNDAVAELMGGTGFEHGLYWPGYKAPRRPLAEGAHFVAGFDAGAFLAYLVNGLGGFPPASVLGPTPYKSDDAGVLFTWKMAFEKKRQMVRDACPKQLSELLKRAVTARGEEYDQLIAQLWKEFDVHMRFKEWFDSSSARIWRSLADWRSPREAKALLRHLRKWQDGYFESAPDAEQRAFIIAGLNGHLARFYAGAEADALFDEGDRAMVGAARPVTPATLVYHASHAELLAKWAIQETGAASAAIFERARDMFRKLIQAHGQGTTYLYPSYVYALQDRARVVSPAEAAGLLAEAREYAERYLNGNPKDADRWWTKARAALSEGDIREAARAFEQFLLLKPGEANFVYPKWGEGLGKLGMIVEAEEKFAKGESLPKASFDLYANWAGALVRAGRWDDAVRRAERAEELQAGSGSYALAQVAAAKGDHDGVRRWLGRSAEYGKIPSLVEVLRDTMMKEYRDEVGEVF